MSKAVRRFNKALRNHTTIKAALHGTKPGVQRGSPWQLIGSAVEELGEVATDLARQRSYGAVAECLDVALSAMQIAVALDPRGEVLRHILSEQKCTMKARKLKT